MGLDIKIEIDSKILKELVINYLESKLGDIPLDESKIQILVMSTQNYIQKEWEDGKFKAVYKVIS